MNYAQIGFNAERNCFLDKKASLPTKIKWKTKLVQYQIEVALSEDDLLYLMCCGTKDNKLFKPYTFVALNAENGKVLWEWTSDEALVPRFCIWKGTMIVDSSRRRVAIKEGMVIWSHDNQGESPSSEPLVYADTVVLSHSAGLRFIDPSTGQIIRRFDCQRASGAACFDNRIVFGDRNAPDDSGNLYCLDFETAEPIWTVNVAELGSFYDKDLEDLHNQFIAEGATITDKPSDYNRKGHVSGLFPMIADERVYCSLTEYYVACFCLKSGKLLWKTSKQLSPFYHNTYANGWLYNSSFASTYRFNIESGEIVARNETVGGTYPSLSFILDDFLILNTEDRILFLHLDTQQIAWEYRSKHRKIEPFFNPFYLDGKLYNSCNDGYMYCFV